jgi:hypothetical protein
MGSKRNYGGRKSLPDEKKKVQVSIYVEKEIIEKYGGMQKFKERILEGVI